MLLDVKTLIISLTAISAMLCLVLVFYWADRKTYHGFEFWVVGTLLSAAGYFLLVLRTEISLGLSVLGSNLFFSGAAVCKLDGVRRFIKDRALGKAYYVLPFLVAGACALFYFAFDHIGLRVFIVGLTFSALSLAVAWHLIRYAPSAYHLTYYTSGGLYILFVFAIMFRALSWLGNSGANIWITNNYNTLYFLFMTIFEVASAAVFIIITGQRTEAHLHGANLALDQNIAKLIKAMSEIKRLRGILPFCSFCKKIRDDRGYWEKVDIYIHKHSGADISHGICPECLEQHYPEEFAAICQKTGGNLEPQAPATPP
jgi:hypothetical protein